MYKISCDIIGPRSNGTWLYNTPLYPQNAGGTPMIVAPQRHTRPPSTAFEYKYLLI